MLVQFFSMYYVGKRILISVSETRCTILGWVRISGEAWKRVFDVFVVERTPVIEGLPI